MTKSQRYNIIDTNNGNFTLYSLKLDNEVGAKLNVALIPESGNVKIELISKNDTVLDTKEVPIQGYRIKSVYIDYPNHQMVFVSATSSDETKTYCDISSLISTFENAIDRESDERKNADLSLKDHIDLIYKDEKGVKSGLLYEEEIRAKNSEQDLKNEIEERYERVNARLNDAITIKDLPSGLLEMDINLKENTNISTDGYLSVINGYKLIDTLAIKNPQQGEDGQFLQKTGNISSWSSITEGILKEDLTADIDVGFIKKGTSFPAGTSIESILKIAFTSNIRVTGIELNKSSLINVVGASEKLIATVLPDDAKNKNVLWNTSDGNVARVDNDGNVFFNNLGTAVITATSEDGGFTATCDIKVVSQLIPNWYIGSVQNTTSAAFKGLSSSELILNSRSEYSSTVSWSPNNNNQIFYLIVKSDVNVLNGSMTSGGLTTNWSGADIMGLPTSESPWNCSGANGHEPIEINNVVYNIYAYRNTTWNPGDDIVVINI